MSKDLFPSTHPLTPPQSMEELAAWFRLLRSRRVGPTTFYRLMQEHGSIDAALAALPEIAKAAGVKNYELCTPSAVQAELNAGRMAGATPIPFGTVGYPEKLAELPDAPPIVWTLGNPELLNKPMIALVGARNASSLGTRMARQLASGLAEAGFIVVSGLARGIDAAAHIAAKDSGTLAVMAGGVDVVYPAENAVLAQEILDQGLRLSEQPMGLQPIARHFPQRNRIISGISQAVVVVEAAARSGSLITAKNALDQGRDVLVVPGHPFDARASGCNMLIRDGAQLVRNVDDIVETLTPVATATPSDSALIASPSAPRPAIEQAKLHSEILTRLGPSPVAEDQLIRDLDIPAAEIAPELVNLELQGVIIRQSGGLLSKSPSA